MRPSLYYKQQHKNMPRSGEQILGKLDNLEVIIGRHLTFLNKQDGLKDKVYDKINSEPSSVAANDTKFHIINKR